MDKRQIIFESYVGSHLYGTSRPESDEDFQGVFMPSREDLLGVQNCSTEWSLSKKLSTTEQNTKGDIDRKFYSLKRFFHLAAEGQPGQLELFFAPKDRVISYEPVWSTILDNIGLFLSRKNIVPFIGFAMSQAHKAVMKGATLNQIRGIIAWYDQNRATLNSATTTLRDFPYTDDTIAFGSHTVKRVTNLHGATTAEIGGRNYDVGLRLKVFISNLKELEGRYGERSNAAATGTYDYKSLMHAYRLLGEAEELLQFGKITFPRPPKEVEFLLSIRNGQCGEMDHFLTLHNQIDRLRQEVEPKSFLPKEPDYKGVNDLCIQILSEELRK